MFKSDAKTNITIKRSTPLTAAEKGKANKLSLRLAFKQEQMQRVIDECKSQPEVKIKVSKPKPFWSNKKGCAVVWVGVARINT